MTDDELVPLPGHDTSASIAQGLRWSAVGVVGVRLVNGARGILIARLVGPRALGVFAAAFAFVAAANLFADFGLQSYLVHRGTEARVEARSVFNITLSAGIIGSVLVAVLAIPIGALYDSSDAKAVTLALAVSVLLTGVAVVPNALLRSDLRFRDVARTQIGGEVAGLFVGLSLALAGAGVWALVAGLLANQIVALLLIWCASGKIPPSVKAPTRLVRRRALRYGLTLTAGSLLWAVALQGDNVVVAHALSARTLGFYAFAYSYGVLPGVIIGSMVTDVALASFSAARSTQEQQELLLRFARITAIVGTPIVAIAIAVAPDAIRLVLGSIWLPAAGPLRILLVVGWIRGLYPAETLLRARGRVGVELRIGLVAAPLTVGAALIGSTRNMTLVALLVGGVLTSAALVSTALGAHSVGLTLRRVAAAPLTPAVLAGGIAGGVAAIGAVSSPSLAVFVAAPGGLMIYALLVRLVSPEAWREVLEVARTKARPSAATELALPPVVVEDL